MLGDPVVEAVEDDRLGFILRGAVEKPRLAGRVAATVMGHASSLTRGSLPTPGVLQAAWQQSPSHGGWATQEDMRSLLPGPESKGGGGPHKRTFGVNFQALKPKVLDGSGCGRDDPASNRSGG